MYTGILYLYIYGASQRHGVSVSCWFRRTFTVLREKKENDVLHLRNKRVWTAKRIGIYVHVYVYCKLNQFDTCLLNLSCNHKNYQSRGIENIILYTQVYVSGSI